MMAVMVAICCARHGSAERVEQVLDTVPVVATPSIQSTHVEERLVSFEHVTFSYPGSERPCWRPHLHSRTRPDQRYHRRTGSGKTTLLNLIRDSLTPRAAPSSSTASMCRDQRQETLWASIGLVPQAAYLFTAPLVPTCASVVLTRPTSNSGGVGDRQASDFVSPCRACSRPPIDQGGTNVSGGQRQRLSIARALVKAPSVYLFDDCFSPLGPPPPTRAYAPLEVRNPRASVVIVAQRVSTIMHAERIIVLDDGRVVGMGSHNELLENCEPYTRSSSPSSAGRRDMSMDPWARCVAAACRPEEQRPARDLHRLLERLASQRDQAGDGDWPRGHVGRLMVPDRDPRQRDQRAL